MKRGEVWWADLDPVRGSEIAKTRPVVIVTADQINARRRTVAVVPLSTGPTPRPPIILELASAGPRSVAVCDQLRALDRSRLQRHAGRLSYEDMTAVDESLRAILAL